MRTILSPARRTLLALAALLAPAALPVSAAAGEWTAGYTLGISQTDFDGQLGDALPHSQFGFGFGLFVSYPLLPRLTVRPEVLLSVKGASFKEPVFAYYFDEDTVLQQVQIGERKRVVDLTYLELPLIASVALRRNPNANVIPHLQFGAAPSLRILGRFRNGNTLGTEPIDPDKANRFDVSLIGALGADVTTRRGVLRFDLRYAQGMLDVYRSREGPPGRNRLWSLSVGISP